MKGPSSSHGLPSTLAEINVTPLVDVMLVLLIVFMISAPLLQQGVEVDLPEAKGQGLEVDQDRIVLVVKKSGECLWNNTALSEAELQSKLSTAAAAAHKPPVFVQADENVAYGVVARLLSTVKEAGLVNVGLVTEEPKPERSR
ncbi:MAG: biopolymer transporter ExbD [Candidatus Eisenbacteria bacterium]